MAQFFVDLKNEKSERLKLHAMIRQLEDELAQLRQQVNEPSPSSLPVPFTVDPPCFAAFQDTRAVNSIQLSKPMITVTPKRASSATPKPRPPDRPPSPPTSRSPPSHLETRDKQLEEKITKASNSHKTIASIYRSQFAFLYDRFRALESGDSDTILWKLTSLKLVFDTAKSSARLDNAAKDPSTHYKSPVYRTHPHG